MRGGGNPFRNLFSASALSSLGRPLSSVQYQIQTEERSDATKMTTTKLHHHRRSSGLVVGRGGHSCFQGGRKPFSVAAFIMIFASSFFSPKPSNAFAPPTTIQSKRWQLHDRYARYRQQRSVISPKNNDNNKLHVVTNIAAETPFLADYAPAAASLFNNMKLPAAVVTAGMISLGFATRFPELPRDTLDKVYPQTIRAQCAKLERLHIVLGLLSVTSELIVVLWAAVAVNQLTERTYEPALSVWDLIHRDCDLAWSAVNSHYILGIIGFTGMLWLRAYVMLLAASASKSLMNAASTGTAAATCLMVSIVNRGVESGGGTAADRYGNTILDLFSHYAALLLKVATDDVSPGPLQLSAIILEIASLCFMFKVLITESDASFEQQVNEEDSCPIDAYDVLKDDKELSKLTTSEVEKLRTCVGLEEEEEQRQLLWDSGIITGWMLDKENEREKQREDEDSGDYSSVNVSA